MEASKPEHTELDKCMAGEIYDCHDPIFLDYKNHARRLLAEYNRLAYDEKERKTTILRELFGSIGENVSVGLPFICDYGRNIHIGSNVSVNMNCTFVDCNTITIGSDTLIASNVQLYTATHPVELHDRLREDWTPGDARYRWHTYARPITIGRGCWLGGGVIVLPGVTIGAGTVIGAGSVVTRDIPANVVAVGNPCRVLRRINDDESATTDDDR
ncbi:sugar O-acetyltransferase [Bifidobacterium callimiconis]|uniref:Maltose acetyltransferase n=1 Tax=Bifidobacterium callimiconis TaxID=2306973 RepID=A0A430FHJ2_9BIFI|nr:sugar O-acetyltransferase [Bifidobacterium callimiconis]RSX52353.1 maltose acetyltransferase [Bifidobacterium callimiconis]